MIYLPNKFERFCASLRNYIQRRSLIGPITAKQRGILKKILLAEAVFMFGEEQPIDIKNFSKELLGALQIKRMEKGEKLRFLVEAENIILTDLKAFEVLLVFIGFETSFIRIFSTRNGLVIETENINNSKIRGLVTAFKGNCFYECKADKRYIVLPTITTTKPTVKITREWEYLGNPFSCVNLF